VAPCAHAKVEPGYAGWLFWAQLARADVVNGHSSGQDHNHAGVGIPYTKHRSGRRVQPPRGEQEGVRRRFAPSCSTAVFRGGVLMA
jgi:hypothetical protein